MTAGSGGARGGLEAMLTDGLAELANSSLNLDPASRARLAALHDRSVELSARLPLPFGERHFTLRVEHDRLRLYPGRMGQPNVVVRGSAADIAAWLLRGGASPGRHLAIDGDDTVLQELVHVARAFRPDPAGPLGRLVGDELAGSLIGTAELALAALRSAASGAGSAVRRSAGSYFVDRRQADGWLDEMDDLRQRIDRLAARVNAEEARRNDS